MQVIERARAALLAGVMLVAAERGVAAGMADVDATPVDARRRPVSVLCGPAVVAGGLRHGADRDAFSRHFDLLQGLVADKGLCRKDAASRWSEAQDLAISVVQLSPDDANAWQVIATRRYMTGDVMGALDAWNRTGEPRIDTIDVHGAERTRQPVVVRAARLHPRQVLTPEVFGRALRRLRELPVASNARMTYAPSLSEEGAGLARVDLSIDERQVVPRGWPALGTIGARALLLHELRAVVAGPLGAGELASATWRWSTGRPRVALGLALPSHRWLPGIVSIEGSWERQSYDATPASSGVTPASEERRRVGLHLSDWSTSWLRWQAGAALDHLRQYDAGDHSPFDTRNYLAVESSVDLRLASERVAVTASGGWWAPSGGGDRFGTAGLLAAWRSTDETTVPFWSVVTNVAVTSRVAPLALWPGAGTTHARGGLLRAHPLMKSGILTGPAFGREVAQASLEYERPIRQTRAGGLAITGFADTARAWHRLNGLDTSPLYLDAGVGVLLHPRGTGGTVRLDIAHGLRGGGTTFSGSWGGAWPQ